MILFEIFFTSITHSSSYLNDVRVRLKFRDGASGGGGRDRDEQNSIKTVIMD